TITLPVVTLRCRRCPLSSVRNAAGSPLNSEDCSNTLAGGATPTTEPAMGAPLGDAPGEGRHPPGRTRGLIAARSLPHPDLRPRESTSARVYFVRDASCVPSRAPTPPSTRCCAARPWTAASGDAILKRPVPCARNRVPAGSPMSTLPNEILVEVA